MINSRGEIPWKLWREYVSTAPRKPDGGPALLNELSGRHLSPVRHPLQSAITSAGNGENMCRDLIDLLVETDMCIPGPGLHTSGWDHEGSPISPDLEPYKEILAPLRHRQYLREVHKDPENRFQVVKAARSHLLGCVAYLTGRAPRRDRRALSACLRDRAVSRSIPVGLRGDMEAFANFIDRTEDDNYSVSVAEALSVYFLSRWFGYKMLEAAAGAEGVARFQEALEQAAEAGRDQVRSQ